MMSMQGKDDHRFAVSTLEILEGRGDIVLEQSWIIKNIAVVKMK